MCAVGALSLKALQAADSLELKGSKPNIIVVMTDDQGKGDLACLGNPILKTPHIDQFYNESTRFTDFHVSASCAPTRAALMSGRHEFRVGVTHTIFGRERMNINTFTLPEALKTAGYTTGIFGKWHLGDSEEYLPHSRGFDESLVHGAGGIGQVSFGDFPPNGKNTYYDSVMLHNNKVVKTKGYCTDFFFQASLDWIKAQHQAKKPYFAYISTNAPHTPNIVPAKYSERFKQMGWSGGKKGAAERFGMIENLDDNFGLLMKTLEEWGALENTLVIFMTDNGMNHITGKKNGKETPFYTAGLRGKKGTEYEGGTLVPAFWYWKDTLGKGVDVPALTAHIDLYQTFCALAEVELPEEMQELDGRSLLPLLENPKAVWEDRQLFMHVGRWRSKEDTKIKYNKCAVRTEQWRFVNNTELYDIRTDPSESQNVAQAHPEVVATLRKAYDQWWEQTEPLMINDKKPVKGSEKTKPLHELYKQQLEKGIPEWIPVNLRK